MARDKRVQYELWSQATCDLPDGAAFAMLSEYGLTYEDLEEFAVDVTPKKQ